MMQKRKALKLRDQLIDDDKMELAMQVATKCGLDTFDVWSSWGRGELELARLHSIMFLACNFRLCTYFLFSIFFNIHQVKSNRLGTMKPGRNFKTVFPQ